MVIWLFLTIDTLFKTTHTVITAIYTRKEIQIRTNLSKNSKKKKRSGDFPLIKILIINFLYKTDCFKFIQKKYPLKYT